LRRVAKRFSMDNRETGMGEANVPLRLKERNCIGEKVLRLCGTLLLLERKVVEARCVENCGCDSAGCSKDTLDNFGDELRQR